MDDHDFGLFVEKIKVLTNIDLTQYKESQMKRRLTSLRMRRGFSTFRQYYAAIAQDEQLYNEFLDRITINVSEFWRNPNRWNELQSHIIPELLQRQGPLRCWSAACSTGEEPYSLAMILAELDVLKRSTIIASDIDGGVLNKAKQGHYIERSLRDLPAAYIEKYFTRPDSLTYAIIDELKTNIRFEQKNLLLDTYETNLDLIICRNVMIYFTEEAKVRLYNKFSKALRPGGILFVGSTEQIFSPEKYEFENAGTFFYRKM